jgi:cytochrome c-type biogenesis protein CcmH
MVGRLARRLEKQPDDLQGWLLLGRSYNEIGQFPLAARAYERADKLAGGRNAEALLGMGDALIAAGRSELTGAAGRLFEKALELEPNSVQALLYGALAAMERNELPVARARFARLLEGNPPPEARNLIERQLQVLDSMAVMAAAPTTPAAQAATAATAATAPAAVVRIPVRITLAAGVAGKATAGAPLFVLARVPGQRQPLAAKRLEAKFPQDVELLSTDAMAGGTFAAGQELEVEVRIANGGSAISRSGDPFGVVKIKAGASTRTPIEINQLKP